MTKEEFIESGKIKLFDWLRLQNMQPKVYNAVLNAMQAYADQQCAEKETQLKDLHQQLSRQEELIRAAWHEGWEARNKSCGLSKANILKSKYEKWQVYKQTKIPLFIESKGGKKP